MTLRMLFIRERLNVDRTLAANSQKTNNSCKQSRRLEHHTSPPAIAIIRPTHNPSRAYDRPVRTATHDRFVSATNHETDDRMDRLKLYCLETLPPPAKPNPR